MRCLALYDFPLSDPRMGAFLSLGDDSELPALPARCLLANRAGTPSARCAYQVAEHRHGAPGRSGLVGHYEARDADAGIAILNHATELLAEQGVSRVLGPMHGSTWARYRLAHTSENADLPFLTEPVNPPDYPEHWEHAGFLPVAWYESRIDEDPGRVRPRAEALAERLARRGITVRPLDLERYDEDLEAIFDLSRAAFAENRYYTPIPFEEFRAMYDRLRPLLDPELVLLAHGGAGKLLGFFFAFPDPVLIVNGRPVRVVAKTVAVAPEARHLGLGMHLSDRLRARVHARGYRAMIHALIHVENDSMKSPARHDSRLFRRYVLYEWRSSPSDIALSAGCPSPSRRPRQGLPPGRPNG